MTRSLLAAALLSLAALAPLQTARAADPQDPDWPCIQRKMPEISAGMVWAGPPVEPALESWQDDSEVARLAGRLSARSLPVEEAVEAVEAFASGLGDQRDSRLTRLFAGLLETINRERRAIMNGIERYTRKQRAMAERIEQTGSSIDRLALEDGDAETRARLEQQQTWDIRIYQDREHALTYLCQQPIDLEQRLFQLSRAIMQEMK